MGRGFESFHRLQITKGREVSRFLFYNESIKIIIFKMSETIRRSEEDFDLLAEQYNPFNAEEELKKIGQFSEQEEQLPPAEKRKLKKERLVEFKNSLLMQKLGMGEVIYKLRSAIEANPSADIYALEENIVDEAVRNYRFTADQRYLLDLGLEEYEKRHEIVEKYREKYPNDSDLFQACFGKKPKGQIEVLYGPMTMFFRCYDRDDYLFVYAFYKTKGDASKIEDNDVERAKTTGGIALKSVKISELAGIITAENVSANNPESKFVEGVQKTEIINDDETTFAINNIKDIRVNFNGLGAYWIRAEEYDDRTGNPIRFQIFEMARSKTEPVVDVGLSGNFNGKKPKISNAPSGSLIDFRKSGVKDSLVKGATWLVKDGQRKNHGYISINGSVLTIQSDGFAEITYEQDEVVTVPNAVYSKKVQQHEDQHQFDNLFLPLETNQKRLEILSEADEQLSGAKNPTEFNGIENDTIKLLARLKRVEVGVDSKARSEILAYYVTGESLDFIKKTLTESELYDYAKIYKGNFEFFADLINKDMGDIHARNLNGLSIDVTDEAMIELENAFKKSYYADLKNWIDAVKTLEKKGYGRKDIISILQQEPVNSWANLARRLP